MEAGQGEADAERNDGRLPSPRWNPTRQQMKQTASTAAPAVRNLGNLNLTLESS